MVYVERGSDSSAKWLFWGALLGAGVALLYAPHSGEVTRRSLQRRLWKLRAMTEETMDDLLERFGPEGKALTDRLAGGADLDDSDDEESEEPESQSESARDELDRRLAKARAARRRRSAEPEEPPA